MTLCTIILIITAIFAVDSFILSSSSSSFLQTNTIIRKTTTFIPSPLSLLPSDINNLECNEEDEECELFEMGWNPEPPSASLIQDSTTITIDDDDDDDDYNDMTLSLPKPNPNRTALQTVQTCLHHLQQNNIPQPNSGLQICFDFSSDRCRALQGGTIENFISFASNPTFGSMVECDGWMVISVGNLIRGTRTRGDMQTILVEVWNGEEEDRKKFLWTMQKERRPPRMGCWLVHECLFVDKAYEMTV